MLAYDFSEFSIVPYLIRLRTDEPMFFAALAQVNEDIEMGL
jgi:putative SOS response-associated peptidase YedK